MAKKSRKQPSRPEKDNAGGCMSGLISIFDFRQGRSTQRLLSDRRHGSSRRAVGNGSSRSKFNLLTGFEQEDLDDIDKNEPGRVDLDMTSVKELMEEEMSRVQQTKMITNAEIEQIRSDLGCDVHFEKNHKKANDTCMAACDLLVDDMKSSVSLVSDQSHYPNPIERFSYNLDLAALMEEVCSNKHRQEPHTDCKNTIDLSPTQKSIGQMTHNHLDQPDARLVQDHSILQKALTEVAEAFLNHRLSDAKQLICGETLCQSKEVIDALEILNSNKELFLKLLQDPSSLLVKHIQNLQNDREEKLSKLESCKLLEGGKLLEEETGSSRQCKELVSRKLFQKQNVHNFSRERNKSQGTKLSKGNDSSQALSRIVVLKPTPAGIQNPSNPISPSSSPQSHYSLRAAKVGNERAASHFSLKEIKRWLKHAVGESRKEQHSISTDGVLHRIPNESQQSGDAESASKTFCSSERASQPSSGAKRRDKKRKPKESRPSIELEIVSERVDTGKSLNMPTASNSLHRESNFRREARKHLAELLNISDEDGNSPTTHVSKPLGRILALPEYNLLSPRLSPGREKALTLSPRQMRFSPPWQPKQENTTNCLSPLRQNIESSTCTDTNRNVDLQVLGTNPTLLDTQIQENISSGEVSSPKGCTEIVETVNIECIQGSNSLDVLSELNSSDPTADVAERCEEGSSMWSRVGSSEETSQLMGPLVPATPVSVLVRNTEAPESIIDKPERPSPVSVLEPLFLEDIISPGSDKAEHAELPTQPLHIHFEEHDNSAVVLATSECETNLRTWLEDNESKFEYVRAVLEASGLSFDGLSERFHPPHQLLNPSLFDEVEFPSAQTPDDPKHLFDCINEVLEEIHDRFFSCTPWVSFVKPNIRTIPSGENFIQEIWKAVNRHLLPPLPHTLDQIVGKNMDAGTWMDLRFETEGVSIEMGDAILEKIMEETVLELWD